MTRFALRVIPVAIFAGGFAAFVWLMARLVATEIARRGF